MNTYQLTDYRHPDGSFNGRPYVTLDGQHVCEGYLSEPCAKMLADLVAQANQATALSAALRHLVDAVTMPWVQTRLAGAAPDNDVEIALATVRPLLGNSSSEGGASVPASHPLRLVIHIEDGLVQGVISDRPATYLVADCDVEGADAEDLIAVPERLRSVIGHAREMHGRDGGRVWSIEATVAPATVAATYDLPVK